MTQCVQISADHDAPKPPSTNASAKSPILLNNYHHGEKCGLGCTDAELRAVVEEMPALPMRSVLLKREAGSVILQTELSGMADEIAVLSGRAATVRLLDQVRADHGDLSHPCA
jgi:type IV secretory pathway VirB4 component